MKNIICALSLSLAFLTSSMAMAGDVYLWNQVESQENCTYCGRPSYFNKADTINVVSMDSNQVNVEFLSAREFILTGNVLKSITAKASYASNDVVSYTAVLDSRRKLVFTFLASEKSPTLRVEYRKDVNIVTSWSETASKTFELQK